MSRGLGDVYKRQPYGCQKVVLTSGENGYGIPELQAVLNAAVAGEQEAE